MLLPNDVLQSAAEGLLRAYGSWCSRSLSVEKIKLLDACHGAGKQLHEGGPACIVQNKLLANSVTMIARQQSRSTLALLSHVAWCFNSQYGLPTELDDLSFEINSLPELERLFETLHRSHKLPSEISQRLQQQRGMREWLNSKGQEGFKWEAAGIMLSLREPLMNALENMLDYIQQSVTTP